jgi:demethylmenaquinone methyltransferase/2-methoxy-6-polyprenyl-1,4-benzoquinol methylase
MTMPAIVDVAMDRAEAAGFQLSCDVQVGQLLAVLSAAVPPEGRILELGTGTGVGLAWIVHGLESRTDVEVVSVELSPDLAAVAGALEWPPFVHLEIADALEVVARGERYDLIFADAQGGKWEGLDDTIASLRPAGLLLVDDMTPPEFMNDEHRKKTPEVRRRLLEDDQLVHVEMDWATGIILCARQPAGNGEG